jgi:hypothetical protein
MVLMVAVAGCGGTSSDSSAEQARIEQARRSGAAAAHQGDAIRQLQKEVKVLSSRSTSTATAQPQTEPESSHDETSDPRIPASGTYVGEALQRGTPTSVDKDYPVQMTFSSSGSYVSYPSLACAGNLQPTGFDGGDRVYEERITTGHCDDGGTWLVHVEGPTTLEAAWSSPSTTYTVTAVVDR